MSKIIRSNYRRLAQESLTNAQECSLLPEIRDAYLDISAIYMVAAIDTGQVKLPAPAPQFEMPHPAQLIEAQRCARPMMEVAWL